MYFSTQKVAAYEGILQVAKGSANEKKLAAGFITRYSQWMCHTVCDVGACIGVNQRIVIHTLFLPSLPFLLPPSPPQVLLSQVICM